ncbi:MAG: hypothetical protein KKB82_02210 [Candidatus Omnitrophica bacterium]|nr:hypothetical protein [Candidatus Omnitrophota bacterium]
MNGQINAFLKTAKDIILRYKRQVVVVLLMFLLYFFVVVTYQAGSKAPSDAKSQPKQHSYLNLVEFINGYRSFQQDFIMEDVRFGDTFLAFSLYLKTASKSKVLTKQLAMDMIVGLLEEYPELETISIQVCRMSDNDKMVIYGRAEYEKKSGEVNWRFN